MSHRGFPHFLLRRGRRGIPVVSGAARNFQHGGGEVFRLFGGRRGIFNRGAARYSGYLGGGEKFITGGGEVLRLFGGRREIPFGGAASGELFLEELSAPTPCQV